MKNIFSGIAIATIFVTIIEHFMAFVTEITTPQKSLMPSYRKKWHEIAFSTNRIDRQKASESVQSVQPIKGLGIRD